MAAGATFFTVAGALALGVVALVYRTNISHFLCPRDALPSHLKEVRTSTPNHPISTRVFTPSFSLVSSVTLFFFEFKKMLHSKNFRGLKLNQGNFQQQMTMQLKPM